MKLSEIPDIDKKGLRQFGYTMAIVICGLFGLFFPWLLEKSIPLWPWMVGAVFVLWATLAANSMRGLYNAWMTFGLLMGRIMTPLILGLVFFVVFAPLALGFRLFGRDTMNRKWDSKAKTYRIHSTKSEPEKIERPF